MSASEQQRFRSSGGELAYTYVGDGAPVLLVHGFPLSSFTWRALVPTLARRHRVIVPDLLGYGSSERPSDVALDLPAQARYVRELLEHLDVGRVAVVGHAHGGGIAQLLALDGTDVAAMVLVSSVAFDAQFLSAWPVESMRELQRVDPEHLTSGLVEGGMRAALLTGAGDPAVVTDDVVSAYLAPWIGEGGPAAFVRAAHGIGGGGLTGHDAAFAEWDFPIMLLWGEEDPFLPPPVAERLHDALPTSSLGLLPGVGHLVLDEAGPTVVPMIAEWLRATYLRAPHTHAQDGVVVLQLERRSALEDLAEYEDDDPPVRWEPGTQEVGPNA